MLIVTKLLSVSEQLCNTLICLNKYLCDMNKKNSSRDENENLSCLVISVQQSYWCTLQFAKN